MNSELTVIIPTAYRLETLVNTLEALEKQHYQADRIIIADGAAEFDLADKLENFMAISSLKIDHVICQQSGAAIQRNEAAARADSDILFFLDDDVYPEPDCLANVMAVFHNDPDHQIGGVGCILNNEQVPMPSKRAKRWFDFLADEVCDDYRGRVIGPALNFYARPDVTDSPLPVDWLNSGCTAYRKLAFDDEKFNACFFMDYSFMEDLDLSIRVARNWKLVVETRARSFHDAQPSRYKTPFRRSKMAVRNRYHVMSNTLQRISFKYHAKFVLLHAVNYQMSLIRCRSMSALWERIREGAGFTVGFLLLAPKMIGNSFRSLFRSSKSGLHNVRH